MSIPSISAIAPVIRKLESVFTLAEDERAALMRLQIQAVDLRTDQDIIREGDRPSRCFAILEGFACMFKMTGEGKRMILGFHIAGDVPDLQSLHLEVLDSSIGTITPCKVGFIQHEPLRGL